jgi:hypothetical protein
VSLEFYFSSLPQFRIHLRNTNTDLVTAETTENTENLHYIWRFLSVNFLNLREDMLLSITIFTVIQVTLQILAGCHMALRVRKRTPAKSLFGFGTS